jgi:hypothetical protein
MLPQIVFAKVKLFENREKRRLRAHKYTFWGATS